MDDLSNIYRTYRGFPNVPAGSSVASRTGHVVTALTSADALSISTLQARRKSMSNCSKAGSMSAD